MSVGPGTISARTARCSSNRGSGCGERSAARSQSSTNSTSLTLTSIIGEGFVLFWPRQNETPNGVRVDLRY